MKKAIIAVTVALLVLSLFGCGNNGKDNDETSDTSSQTTSSVTTSKQEETTETGKPYDYAKENMALQTLLPESRGYIWKYEGFAEYGHRMSLDSLFAEKGRKIYMISGNVDDMTGEGPESEYEIEYLYIIQNGELSQYAGHGKQMDSAYAELVLIRTPLDKGMTWTQTAVTKEGVEAELICEIKDIRAGDKRTYVIRYEQKDSGYHETREITENTGLTAFSRQFISDGEEHEIGFWLNKEMSGYPEEIQLKSILPQFDTELSYYGLAEYAHRVKWSKTYDLKDRTIYEFQGSFEDGSGIPGDFIVSYTLNRNDFTVTETVIDNTREDENLINSITGEMVILKAPLTAGNSWRYEVVVQGERYMMDAVIKETWVSLDEPYLIYYRIRYTITGIAGYFNDTYIQERVFRTGRGMTGFMQLMEGDIGISGKELEDEYLVGQALMNHMFGYSQHISE